MAKRKIKKTEKAKELSIDSNIISTTENFSNRFNIAFDKTNREAFKNRCINAIGEYTSSISKQAIDFIEQNIATLLGLQRTIQRNSFQTLDVDWGFNFNQTKLHGILNSEDWNLSEGKLLYKWLMVLEMILNANYDDADKLKVFSERIVEALTLSDIDATLYITSDGYRFYPAGAKLLDKKLVIDVLNWLNAYPKAKEQYDHALRLFLKGDRTRQIVDSMRLALELTLKQLLNNNQSIEKQISELGQYLENRGIATEIRNSFQKILDIYAKYNNVHAKHDDNVRENEIEFIIYLTGSFIRFIITA